MITINIESLPGETFFAVDQVADQDRPLRMHMQIPTPPDGGLEFFLGLTMDDARKLMQELQQCVSQAPEQQQRMSQTPGQQQPQTGASQEAH